LGAAVHVDARGYITLALQPTVALREETHRQPKPRLTSQPNLGEAVLARGINHLRLLKDYDIAVRYFEQHVSSFP